MGRLATLLLCAVLAGCAAAPVAPRAEALFADALFAPQDERIDAADVFALSAPMQRYLDDEIAARARAGGLQRGLIDALYTRGELKLRYDAALTRNAAQAFDERAGNCLSLVIMTAAFARPLGLQVRYQSVAVDEAWGRQGSLYFAIGHVNLALGGPPPIGRGWSSGADWLTIDFLPPPDLRRQRVRVIDESTLVAMYMNNKAAEALAAGQLDRAYWWARAAIGQDAQLAIAYNTLGVVYQRHGEPARAEQAFVAALTLQVDDPNVMRNLVQVLDAQGRSEQARALAARLERIQPWPPFAYFERGREAMRAGEFAKARALFEREIERDPDYHEFHFWLARALLELGQTEQARKHLALALENSTTPDQQAAYSTKLARLKPHAAQ